MPFYRITALSFCVLFLSICRQDSNVTDILLARVQLRLSYSFVFSVESGHELSSITMFTINQKNGPLSQPTTTNAFSELNREKNHSPTSQPSIIDPIPLSHFPFTTKIHHYFGLPRKKSTNLIPRVRARYGIL